MRQSRNIRSKQWIATLILASMFTLFAGSATMRHAAGDSAEVNAGCVVSMMRGICFGTGSMTLRHSETHIRTLQNIFGGLFQSDNSVLDAIIFATIALLAAFWLIREQNIVNRIRAWSRKKIPCKSPLANYHTGYWIHLFEKRDPMVMLAGAP